MPYIPQGADPWEVTHPQPGRHYRYISSTPEKLGLWLRSFGDRPGYALERGATVKDTKELAIKLGLSAEQVDTNLNRIGYGHNVLASIPMEEYLRRRRELGEKVDTRESDAKEAFLATADELPGVTAFERSPDEHKDRKRIATREDRPFSGQSGVGSSPHLKPRRTRANPAK